MAKVPSPTQRSKPLPATQARAAKQATNESRRKKADFPFLVNTKAATAHVHRCTDACADPAHEASESQQRQSQTQTQRQSQRHTPQRQAVRDALAKGPGPLSAREILDVAAQAAPGLGMATVYRALKLLADEGLVSVVEIPGQSPRYELTGQGHHHHLYCRVCTKVFEVYQCPGDFAELCPPGFKVEGHELVLFGVCARCV